MKKDIDSDNFRIISVTPGLIQVEVVDVQKFKGTSSDFSIGSYLRVSDHSDCMIIAVVKSYRMKENSSTDPLQPDLETSFIIDAQPIGFIDSSGTFKRGGQQIAIPPNSVEIADSGFIQKIYEPVEAVASFVFSDLAQDTNIPIVMNGDKFFGKHIAIVGSTGSGKSATVARVLQEGMKRSEEQRKKSLLNNSHIILFDLHGEYGPAFPSSSKLNVSNIVLPYWLLNSEELEEVLIERGDHNAHNQISQFKYAVTLNKQKYNPGLEKITYDSQVYFNIEEVIQYLQNQNVATKDATTGELKIKDGFTGDKKYELFEKVEFEQKASGKINSGPYAGEFDRFIPRLETKINDSRLRFLFYPKKQNGAEYSTSDVVEIIQQFVGYRKSNEANITLIDLSGIPFEVLSIVVSLISRLVFDFCFYYKSLNAGKMDVPFLLVLEEAHNYIPKSEFVRYRSVKKSIERIAKEGRKYGISLMIVSQRPSEISETIFSQCNNFIAMRLSNPTDQQYVSRLLPDSIVSITDSLPVLEQREALIIGDSIPIPSIVRIRELGEERPDSSDVPFSQEWRKDWINISFEELVRRYSL